MSGCSKFSSTGTPEVDAVNICATICSLSGCICLNVLSYNTLGHCWILPHATWDLFKQWRLFCSCGSLCTKKIARMQPDKPVYLVIQLLSVCVCEVSCNGSYIYAREGDSTMIFQLADVSINTKQRKQYMF